VIADTQESSGYRHPAARSAIALLVFPVLIFLAGIVMIGDMSPIYAGLRSLDYDPAYPYLFNGAGLMKGYNPSLTEHPGTPVQLAEGLVSIICWSIARLFGLTALAFPASIAADPEQYLRAIMIAFLAMNAAAIYWLGAVLARLTGAVSAAMACQAAYLLFGPLFPRMFHGAPEAFLCLSATALMCVLAPILFVAEEECSDRRAWTAGFFIGLGIASKANFFPLLLLTLLLRRPRAILIALASSALFTLFFLLPIVGAFRRVFEWLFSIATHKGLYGTGTTGLMDWAAIPERLAQIAAAEPLLVAAAIALAAVAACSNSRDRRQAVILAAATAALILLVLKHFSTHYLMPVLAIAPTIIVWSLSRFAGSNRLYPVAAAAAAAIGIASTWHMASEFAQERALRRENEKAIADAIAKYDNPVVVGSYRAGYRPWAVLFGLAWSDLKFARTFPQLAAPEGFTYEAAYKKPWRPHFGPLDWSYLDQFEKAGRAVLIIQSRNYRIEPATAKTETILDQGYGDIVARIIVTPTGGSN
jgi:hypothetical protein